MRPWQDFLIVVCLATGGSLFVQFLDGVVVLLVEVEPLELQGRAQLSSRNADIRWQDRPPLHLGGVGHGLAVGLVNASLDGRHHARVGARGPLQDVVHRLGVAPVVLAPLDDGRGELVGRGVVVHDHLEGEEDGEELALVADEHGVGDARQLGLDVLLDGARRDVLAAGRDQELLNSSCKLDTHCQSIHAIVINVYKPVINRKPSESTLPKSPLCIHPSSSMSSVVLSSRLR